MLLAVERAALEAAARAADDPVNHWVPRGELNRQRWVLLSTTRQQFGGDGDGTGTTFVNVRWPPATGSFRQLYVFVRPRSVPAPVHHHRPHAAKRRRTSS